MMSIYMVTKTTSYMFFTAMAGNILALKMINDILHLQISWGGWALAAGLPGIIMLLVTPLVIYTMYPPEIKKVDNKTIAKAGLAELGPMKIREKMLLGVFVLALLGWIFSKSTGLMNPPWQSLLWRPCCCWVSLHGKTWLKIKAAGIP